MVTIMQSLFTLSFYTPQLYNEPDKGRIVVSYGSDYAEFTYDVRYRWTFIPICHSTNLTFSVVEQQIIIVARSN